MTVQSKMLHKTDDLRIKEIKELLPPDVVRHEFPLTERASEVAYMARQEIHRILHGADDRLLVIIGPWTQPHRFIGIWAVVVERRVFVRSWSLKPRSWYRTFLEEPRGTLNVAGRQIPVRAVQTRSERLKDAVDRAYLEKYHTPGSIKYARDLGRAKSRDTTTELVPL